jgi:hypothetical protein
VVGRATATAISRLLAGAIVITSLALAAAGCGGKASSGSKAAFAWLSARPAPAGWLTARSPSGAAMSYPRGWKTVVGDRGTVTVALLRGHSRYLGYLNLTPRQGAETLVNWSRFRVEHNRDEGDRDVTMLAAASRRPFGKARASCVKDSYATSAGAHYIEIACLASGPRGSVVIVGASPPGAWGRISPELERAISTLSV